LLPVENQFFGPSVTVSGLLTGADVSAVLEAAEVEQVFLPRIMLDASGQMTLDGWTPDRLGQESGAVIHTPGDPWALIALLQDGQEDVS
jgi:NifB/MoaA-like Fe-S oxidoreductase